MRPVRPPRWYRGRAEEPRPSVTIMKNTDVAPSPWSWRKADRSSAPEDMRDHGRGVKVPGGLRPKGLYRIAPPGDGRRSKGDTEAQPTERSRLCRDHPCRRVTGTISEANPDARDRRRIRTLAAVRRTRELQSGDRSAVRSPPPGRRVCRGLRERSMRTSAGTPVLVGSGRNRRALRARDGFERLRGAPWERFELPRDEVPAAFKAAALPD
jgi:hypothetical protein